MIRAILFDLDDTLFDRAEAHRRYCLDFMTRHGDAFPEARREADIEILCGDHIVRDRLRFARAVAATFPGLIAANVAADHVLHFTEFVQPDPSAASLLASLSTQYRLAIVSNGSGPVQRAKLARLGLNGSTPKAFISGEVGAHKPAPPIFRKTLEWVGCEPNEAMFVGDDPVRDILGASAIGMRTCWLAKGRIYPPDIPLADVVIDQLGDLAEVVR